MQRRAMATTAATHNFNAHPRTLQIPDLPSPGLSSKQPTKASGCRLRRPPGLFHRRGRVQRMRDDSVATTGFPGCPSKRCFYKSRSIRRRSVDLRQRAPTALCTALLNYIPANKSAMASLLRSARQRRAFSFWTPSVVEQTVRVARNWLCRATASGPTTSTRGSSRTGSSASTPPSAPSRHPSLSPSCSTSTPPIPAAPSSCTSTRPAGP